jgi:NDP-sugar pyrophosphorylase family protein
LKAVVLAGGYATRLRPISYAMPKLLFPVFRKPMIFWTLDLLHDIGVDEVILGVNYMAETLRANVGSTYQGMSIKYSLETQELGTAGPIKLASTNTELNETFIAMNGDVIAEINLQDMVRQHNETKALITDALHEVKTPSRFGVVLLSHTGGSNRIQRFVEKPKQGRAPSHLVNAGIYIIDPSVLQMIPPGQKVSLEREIFPRVAEEGKLYGFPFSGHWFDIGDLKDYREVNFLLLRDSKSKAEVIGRDAQVATDAVIREPVAFGDNSSVESWAHVGPKVLLGKNGSIARHAKVARSILFDRVSIGEGAEVSDAIIATGVRVGRNVKIGRGCIISPNVTIADGVRIGEGAILHPFKEISGNVRAAAHVM